MKNKDKYFLYTHADFMIHQLPILRDNYIYLIDFDDTDTLICVDPAQAEVVIQVCNDLGKTLSHIIITHHHWDHTNGIYALKKRYGCQVIAPKAEAENIPEADVLIDNTTESSIILHDQQSLQILATPGHTLGHLSFLLADALFCGDVLFGAGCGRIFEGTPAMMWESLKTLASLPDDTKIYSAHEYTQVNLRFAKRVDGDNMAVHQRIAKVAALRRNNEPSVPSTLAEELATNPFLRPLNNKFCQQYAANNKIETNPLLIFTHLRAQRNLF
ncbi:MAG: hydroxyacylglutathione hydrolase [Mariprofundales bacterium]